VIHDMKTGKSCPPTAQFALREAELVARNIKAQIGGSPLRGFHFNSLGALCVVGHQNACAELTLPFARGRSMRFPGCLPGSCGEGSISPSCQGWSARFVY
jgi:NADH dehydrogenase FAD-containing subunit